MEDNRFDYTIDCSDYDYDNPQSEVDDVGFVLQELFKVLESKKTTNKPDAAIKLNSGPVTITFYKDTETETTETATDEAATDEAATDETTTTETATTETVAPELNHIES